MTERFTIKLIETEEDCEEVVDVIQDARIIGLDCEGTNLGRQKNSLTLIQIAVADAKTVFLFDIMKLKQIPTFLGSILESKKVLKVIHDCRSDNVAMVEHGIQLDNVFDTTVADQFYRIHYMRRKIKKLKGFTQLSEQYGFHEVKATLPSGKSVQTTLGNIKRDGCDHSLWGKRPLRPTSILYAAVDAWIVLRLYDRIKEKYHRNYDRRKRRYDCEPNVAMDFVVYYSRKWANIGNDEDYDKRKRKEDKLRQEIYAKHLQ